MLQEITKKELLERIGTSVVILKEQAVYSLEELLQDARILIEPQEQYQQIPEECLESPVFQMPEESVESDTKKAPVKKPEKESTEKRHRRTKKEIEQVILASWNGGEKGIKQIMEETGCSYQTVRRYIPLSANG